MDLLNRTSANDIISNQFMLHQVTFKVLIYLQSKLSSRPTLMITLISKMPSRCLKQEQANALKC